MVDLLERTSGKLKEASQVIERELFLCILSGAPYQSENSFYSILAIK